MVWLIVVVAVAVLALAAWAGSGRLGEMPGPVSDRPKGRIPELPFGGQYVAELRLPAAAVGYHRGQVDAFIAAALEEPPREAPVFDLAAHGYDMAATDCVVDRIRAGVRSLADAPSGAPVGEPEQPVAGASKSPLIFEDAE